MITLFASMIFTSAYADTPTGERSRFYDFGDQVIDGEIKQPTVLYSSSREAARFGRLLQLKKSFLSRLYSTSSARVFK